MFLVRGSVGQSMDLRSTHRRFHEARHRGADRCRVSLAGSGIDPRLPVFERERQDRPENVDVQCGRGPIHGLIDERHAGL